MAAPAVPPTTSNPLHDHSGPTTLWTRVNAAEAMPGVLTPLGWTFWIGPSERGARRGFADMGIVSPKDIRCPETADDRLMGIFFGRFALNVEQLRALADLMPGTSAGAMEQQLMGAVRPEAVDHPSRRRYPVMAGKITSATVRQPARSAGVRGETERWWRESVRTSAQTSEEEARREFSDALLRLEESVRIHAISTFLCQALYETLRKVATAAGLPGAETGLTTGYGGLEETGLVTDLWAVSRGELELAAFLDRHGYHGPTTGELSSRSWREDPTPLQVVLDGYKKLTPEESPVLLEQRCARERQRAEATLLARLPAWRRPGTRLLLRLARGYIPLREQTKAAFLLPFDAGRAAARRLGHHLAARGVLDDPEDIFYFTTEEVLFGLPDEAKVVVDERRRQRLEYQAIDVPDSWVGPGVSASAPPPVDAAVAEISGIPVSPGIYEGPARVVLDPATTDFEPGDVLVCETTDPSWAALFLLAGAVVTDIGGAMSHGAIVARELALPAVVNTRTATRQLRTGSWIRVDGSAGHVAVLESQEGSSA